MIRAIVESRAYIWVEFLQSWQDTKTICPAGHEFPGVEVKTWGNCSVVWVPTAFAPKEGVYVETAWGKK